jgi:LacI family transcriptional regulator
MPAAKRKHHVTLEDVAGHLNVTRVTVSKALRGHPDISEKTVRRIQKVARELGYSPNIMARNLSARRSQMLGLVVPKIAHYFFGAVIEAVYDTAFAHTYETILTVSQENAVRERKHLETLVSMRVDGILISVARETNDTEIFHWIKSKGIPLIFIDRQPDPPLKGFSSVLTDDRGGTCQAVEHAIQIGHRRLGFLGGDPHINIGRNRLRGFEDALKRHGIPVNRKWVIQGGFSSTDGFNALMQLHQAGQVPEFVFAVTYPVALGVYEAAENIGLRIPGDIDVMCFGDSNEARFITPPLSCVSQPAHELGVKAVEMILQDIGERKEYGVRHLVLPTGLVLRKTCVKPVRKKAKGSIKEAHGRTL